MPLIQLAGADELAVDENRMVRRDQKIGVRHVVGEGGRGRVIVDRLLGEAAA